MCLKNVVGEIARAANLELTEVALRDVWLTVLHIALLLSVVIHRNVEVLWPAATARAAQVRNKILPSGLSKKQWAFRAVTLLIAACLFLHFIVCPIFVRLVALVHAVNGPTHHLLLTAVNVVLLSVTLAPATAAPAKAVPPAVEDASASTQTQAADVTTPAMTPAADVKAPAAAEVTTPAEDASTPAADATAPTTETAPSTDLVTPPVIDGVQAEVVVEQSEPDTETEAAQPTRHDKLIATLSQTIHGCEAFISGTVLNVAHRLQSNKPAVETTESPSVEVVAPAADSASAVAEQPSTAESKKED